MTVGRARVIAASIVLVAFLAFTLVACGRPKFPIPPSQYGVIVDRIERE